MSRITKILGFSVPPALADEVEQLAKEESRTKSELFREMLRVYLSYRKQREINDDRWVMNLIKEAREEQEINPLSKEEILRESERLREYGVKQTEKLGIKSENINRLVYEYKKHGRNS